MADGNDAPNAEAPPAEEAPKKPLPGRALILMANGDLDEQLKRFGVKVRYDEWQCVVGVAVLAIIGHILEDDREELAIALIAGAVRSDFADDGDDEASLKAACVAALKALGQEDSIRTAHSALDENDDYDYDNAVALVASIAEALGIEIDEDGGDHDDSDG
jgi:hypothetical protein